MHTYIPIASPIYIHTYIHTYVCIYGQGAAPAEADLVFDSDLQSRDDFARLADHAWPHHHTLDEAKDKRVWQGDSDKAPPSFCKSFEELACEEDAALKNLLLASEENRDDPDRKFQRGEISYSELQEAVFGTKSLEASHFHNSAVRYASGRKGVEGVGGQECVAARVHLDILTSQCYSIRVDGVRIASGNQFELAAELVRALVPSQRRGVRGTRIAVKSPAGGQEPAPALYVNSHEILGLHTPLGHYCDAVGKAVWVEFDTAAKDPTLTQESVKALAYYGERVGEEEEEEDSTVHSLCSVEQGRVAVFRWVHHNQGKHIVCDILHRIKQCFKAQAVGVVLVCPEIAELTDHQASEEHLCNAGSIDAAARIVFGKNFGKENHDNNLREFDKPVDIPVWLVSRFVGDCIGAGDEVLMKKWAHTRLVAQGNVTKYQDKYVDTYKPNAADEGNLVVGSTV